MSFATKLPWLAWSTALSAGRATTTVPSAAAAMETVYGPVPARVLTCAIAVTGTASVRRWVQVGRSDGCKVGRVQGRKLASRKPARLEACKVEWLQGRKLARLDGREAGELRYGSYPLLQGRKLSSVRPPTRHVLVLGDCLLGRCTFRCPARSFARELGRCRSKRRSEVALGVRGFALGEERGERLFIFIFCTHRGVRCHEVGQREPRDPLAEGVGGGDGVHVGLGPVRYRRRRHSGRGAVVREGHGVGLLVGVQRQVRHAAVRRQVQDVGAVVSARRRRVQRHRQRVHLPFGAAPTSVSFTFGKTVRTGSIRLNRYVSKALKP
eukprot:392264-Pyramimonas_sp.AAC.2